MNVELIRWPEDEDASSSCASEGVARLLVVSNGDVPDAPDCLEDWVSASAPALERDARQRGVEPPGDGTRRGAQSRHDGLLHHRDHWVSLSPVEQSLAAALLDRFGAVVGATRSPGGPGPRAPHPQRAGRARAAPAAPHRPARARDPHRSGPGLPAPNGHQRERPLALRREPATILAVQLGIDTGGTFTDAVDGDGRVAKVLSTPDDPRRAVADAIAQLAGDGRPDVLAHGTTVATNALLERRGARVALVTTAGFADVIEIARQHRPSLYDPFADRPRRSCRARSGSRWRDGSTRAAASSKPFDGVVPALPSDVEAVAVCLLHADLEPAARAGRRGRGARPAGSDVTASSDLSPEFREYERMVTTVVERVPAAGVRALPRSAPRARATTCS